MATTEDSKALMWRITDEIWNNGRLDLIDELIAEDLVDHVDLAGLEGSGRARYRASVEMMRSAFPDYRNPLDFVIAEDAFAVSYGRSTGTHRGELYGIPPTGRRIDIPTFGILRFENGQAVERWGFADNLAMMQQLGLVS
ncbi:MAG: ester cyclase [Mycobacterium sp.]|uniref:ester cyclase n=1 Tax=Mycobacterium sp. TaxID=1785 RepID=UPI003F958BE2